MAINRMSPSALGFGLGMAGGLAVGAAIFGLGLWQQWSPWIVGAMPLGGIGGGAVGAILGALYSCQQGKSLQGRIVSIIKKDPITDKEL